MPSQIEQAEAQRQRDALARRVQNLQREADELAARLAPRGHYDRLTWAAEAVVSQAAHELEKTKRERREAEGRLSELRAQIGVLA